MLHLFDEDKLRAVAYYRFSAEDKQENSIENQSSALIPKAAAEDVAIIESFEDDGVTGLTFDRPGFQAMLDKYVYSPDAPKIDYILFYDASRFGRVQRMSQVWRLIGELEDKGIRLGSADRGIPKGQISVVDTILMTLDFAMSSEFSRLLSGKVFLGSVKVSEQGYSAGGIAPYGYERILLDEQRQRVRVLPRGVTKEVSNQRVAFEPATDGTADIVKRIFHEFASQGLRPAEIATGLNEDGIVTASGRTWNSGTVLRILTNETYVGTRIYNKTWSRLKEKRRANPPEDWVRCINAHEALIDIDTYYEAQERLYWLRPRSRNANRHRVQKAQTYVATYLDGMIADLHPDQQHYVRRYAPISFGSQYTLHGSDKVCFYIPAQQTKYGELLLCTVDTTQQNAPIEAMYKIDARELSSSYVVLEKSSSLEALERDQLPAAILDVSIKTIQHHAPWLLTTAIAV